MRNVADQIVTNLVAVALGAGMFAAGLKIVQFIVR